MNDGPKVTVRFRMDQEQDRRAYEFLMKEGKSEYHSLNRAVIAAIDEFFSRQKRIKGDPYLETREKEDAFLAKIEHTVRESIQASTLGYLPLIVQSGMIGSSSGGKTNDTESKADEDADLDAALDFVNSL